ncbi:MAG: hypothetical protein QXL57_03340 [Candidatus Bathyarchaeia archaeon]
MNSTFGGLGDNCKAKQMAAKTLKRAIFGVEALCLPMYVGWIIHPYKTFALKH